MIRHTPACIIVFVTQATANGWRVERVVTANSSKSSPIIAKRPTASGPAANAR